MCQTTMRVPQSLPGPRVCGSQQLWPVQRHVSCRASSFAVELLQLERCCLADLPTEELELQLKKHGIQVPTSRSRISKQAVDPAPLSQPSAQPQHNQLTTNDVTRSQVQQPWHSQPAPRQQQPARQRDAAQQSLHKQPPPGGLNRPPQHYAAPRSRRAAAGAARRAQLLEQLAAARVQARSQIVRLPLRLSIAGRAKSRRYLTLPVDVEGTGFVDFLLDSSAYLSRITPAMRDQLGIGPADGVAILTSPGSSSSRSSSSASARGAEASRGSSSSSAAGATTRVRLRQRVRLPKMWLGTAQLPPQQAVVTPLQLPPRLQQFRAAGSSGCSGSSVQRVLSSAGAVGGVLGVQVLREFEVDVDFGGNSVALHPPGHVELGLCDTRGLVEIPLRLTKTGALVIPVSLAGSPPFTGLLDMSAATSMLNWEAAALLGMTCDDDSYSGDDSSTRSSRRGSQQQPLGRHTIRSAGRFGSLQVMPSEDLLLKPARLAEPGSSTGVSHSINSIGRHHSSRDSKPEGQGQQHGDNISSSRRRHSSRSTSRSSGASSSSSSRAARSGAESYSYTPLTASSIVQEHQVPASDVRLVLGHARLAAATPSDGGCSTCGGGSAGSIALPPPSRFGVAGLKAVGQLGLSGQPVMVVGWDVWARQRAVVCLKAGKLFLSLAPS